MNTNDTPRKKFWNHFADTELRTFRRAFEAGNLAVLWDCLVYCRKASIPLPRGAHDAVIAHEYVHLFGKATKRHAKLQRQFRQDMKDLARFETVEQCLEHGVPEYDLYDVAARALAGTIDAGRPG